MIMRGFLQRDHNMPPTEVETENTTEPICDKLIGSELLV